MGAGLGRPGSGGLALDGLGEGAGFDRTAAYLAEVEPLVDAAGLGFDSVGVPAVLAVATGVTARGAVFRYTVVPGRGRWVFREFLEALEARTRRPRRRSGGKGPRSRGVPG